MSESSLPLVSIVIVTMNRLQDVRHVLASVRAQTYPNLEVVLVDNGSTDGTPRVIREEFPDVNVIRMYKNIGCPSGRNLAVANCRGKYFYLLDDDATLNPEGIAECVATAEQYPRLGAVCSLMYCNYQKHWYPGEFKQLTYLSQFYATGVLIRRELFEQIGGFPDDFFRNGEEEYASLLIQHAGYDCVVTPRSIIHHGSETAIAGKFHNQWVYFSIRNSNRTALRLLPFPFNIAKVLKNALNYCKLAWNRNPFIAVRLLGCLLLDSMRTLRTRTPISRAAYARYRGIDGQPVEEQLTKTP